MGLADAVRGIQRRWPKVVSLAQDEPVFVFGSGWRCGSTMLQRMLLRECMVWGEPFGSSGLIERLAQPLQRFEPHWPLDEWFLEKAHWSSNLSEEWTANMYPSVQCFLDAYVEFFRKLLAEPSRQRGYSRWGLKEVRYGIEHAVYLQWLFPRARFLFLVRNPYESWASYRRIGARVMRFWPEALITTPEQFGVHWIQLADGFCNRFR
jgi:Sulfotransferase family